MCIHLLRNKIRLVVIFMLSIFIAVIEHLFDISFLWFVPHRTSSRFVETIFACLSNYLNHADCQICKHEPMQESISRDYSNLTIINQLSHRRAKVRTLRLRWTVFSIMLGDRMSSRGRCSGDTIYCCGLL